MIGVIDLERRGGVMPPRRRKSGAEAREGSGGGRDGAAYRGRRISRRLSNEGGKAFLSADDIK